MQKFKHRSLPKTQPTKTSSQQKYDLHQSFYQALAAPQVSQFSLNDTHKYIHNMDIDYGRIQEPKYHQIKIMTQGHQQKNEHQHQHELECKDGKEKMVTNKKLKKQPSYEIQQSELTERVPKVFKMNPELSESSQPTKRGQKTSSYKKLNKSVELSSKLPTLRLKEVYAINGGSSSKKKLHTRIVKSYVAGGKMQVRLINYPDTTEYQKLCKLSK